jgi:hypothetical protein
MLSKPALKPLKLTGFKDPASNQKVPLMRAGMPTPDSLARHKPPHLRIRSHRIANREAVSLRQPQLLADALGN